MAERTNNRPAWIGHWIPAVVTSFRGYDKEEGKLLDLAVQSTLNTEFSALLPAWVSAALAPGAQARSLSVDLSGHQDVGLEFRHKSRLIFKAERSHLAAAMSYVRLESGWHCRIKLTIERAEPVVMFADRYQGESIELRLFDLESEQGRLPMDGKRASAGETEETDE